MTVKILIISARFFPRPVGSANTVYLLATKLSERGHQVTVLTDASLQSQHELHEFTFQVRYISDLENYAVGATGYEKPLRQLSRLLMVENYDVIHSCNLMPLLLLVFLQDQITTPVVVSLFSTPNEQGRVTGYYEDAGLDNDLARTILAASTFEIAFAGSDNYYQTLLGLGVPPEKIKRSNLGFDEERFDDSRAPNQVAGQYIDTSADSQPLLLIPARVTPQKGILDVITALPTINKVQPVRLLITGMADPFDQDYADVILQTAEKLGVSSNLIIPQKSVAYTDVPALFAVSDIVIVPSHSEGLGMSAIEALYAGKPLITTDIAGLKEIANHEVNALVVPPHTPEAIAGAVIRLLSYIDLAHRLRVAGRASVRAFSSEQYIADTEREYYKLAGTHT